MEYVYILIAIVGALIWIFKQIAAFLRWAARSIQSAGIGGPGLSTPQARASVTETPPGPATTNPARRPTAAPRRTDTGMPTIARRTEIDSKIRQQAIAEPQARSVAPEIPRAAPPNSPRQSLFLSSDDLLRAVILQEILRPPVSRRDRRKPPTS